MKGHIRALAAALALLLPTLAAACGKVDVGVIGAHMDVLLNGKVQKSMTMGGVRADATLQAFPDIELLRGVVTKWQGTFADGDGTFWMLGVGVGHYIPLTDVFAVTPIVGFCCSALDTEVDYGFPLGKVRQETLGTAPYLGMDLCYKLNEQWLLSGSVQYGWAAGRTQIARTFASKSESSGWGVSAMVDYYLTPEWSVNLAWAMNNMLTKELHGTRGSGLRLGVGFIY